MIMDLTPSLLLRHSHLSKKYLIKTLTAIPKNNISRSVSSGCLLLAWVAELVDARDLKVNSVA
jgi:hypothetical protein